MFKVFKYVRHNLAFNLQQSFQAKRKIKLTKTSYLASYGARTKSQLAKEYPSAHESTESPLELLCPTRSNACALVGSTLRARALGLAGRSTWSGNSARLMSRRARFRHRRLLLADYYELFGSKVNLNQRQMSYQ